MKQTLLWLLLAGFYLIACKKLGNDADEPDKIPVTLGSSINSSGNLLLNGSFENSGVNIAANWTILYGQSQFSITTLANEVYEGIHALKVVNPTANNEYWKIQLSSDAMSTQIGMSYRIRVWAKAAIKSNYGIRIQTRGGATQYLGSHSIDTAWASYDWVLTPTTTSTKILFDFAADANTYLIDDITVTPVKSYSTIWGENGELWDKNRLPDFTNAGYNSGNSIIPDYPVSVDVTKLGAVGDGVTDNTAIFRTAIKQCARSGTVYIPAGKYLLSDTLLIKRSGVNIKGAGATTILYFTQGLEELYPNIIFPPRQIKQHGLGREA